MTKALVALGLLFLAVTVFSLPVGDASGKCCRICSKSSIACGDSCIDKGATCHSKPGCACNGSRIDTEFDDFSSSTSPVGCQDEDGNSVDWWFIYKLPQGFNYAYRDSNSRETSALSMVKDKTLDCTTCGALGHTLHQVYTNKDGLAYMFYNDEYPDSYPSPTNRSLMGGGHSKGVIASDLSTGFWLIHSVPKFPDLTAKSFTWTASHEFGQSFLCLSIKSSDADNIAKNLQYSYPHTFTWNIPKGGDWESTFSNLQDTVDGKGVDGSGILPFDVNGTPFQSFSKSPSWNNDLYEFLVEPTLKVSKGFFWETWRRSPFEDKFCKGSKYQYNSLNVESIKVDGFDEFKSTMDHCKWGISAEETKPYVCVGDINRMQSQFARGGQTTCFLSEHLWSGLKAVISQVDNC